MYNYITNRKERKTNTTINTEGTCPSRTQREYEEETTSDGVSLGREFILPDLNSSANWKEQIVVRLKKEEPFFVN